MSTAIQWTDETINPIAAFDRETGKRGWFCVHASTGCLNCYAERTNGWRGNGHKYRLPNATKVDLSIVESILAQPLYWRKPKKIFVCSMTDLFLEQHADDLIDRVFAMMAATSWHTYQVLTKRARRMMDYLSTPGRAGAVAAETMRDGMPLIRADELAARWPLPNVWHGVSAENQEQFDERVPYLVSTPGITTPWVSYEPALGPLQCRSLVDANCAGATLSWIVIGGESGTNARPFNIEWASDVIRQCRAVGITRPFVKQLGAVPMESEENWRGRVVTRVLSAKNRDRVPPGFVPLKLHDGHGGDIDEWPEQLRVREFPSAEACA